MFRPNIFFIIIMAIVNFGGPSQARSDEDILCNSVVNCPDQQDTQFSEMAESLPRCYCDDLCLRYKDCCKLKQNQTEQVTEFQKIRYKEDPTTFSVCLALDGQNIGFWVVNRCGSNGPICQGNITMAFVLSHLPVTDMDNMTYLNEDCAKCNNVSTYEFWSIFFEKDYKTLHEDEFDPQKYISKLMKGEFLSKENQHGKIYITPPHDVSVRVCYRFEWDNVSNSSHCPDYQVPIAQKLNQKKIDFYRNLQCCKDAGKCVQLRSDECSGELQYSNIKIFSSESYESIDNPFSIKRMPGVLLQSTATQQKCRYRKLTCTKSCTELDERCASGIKILNFPLERRFMKFIILISENKFITIRDTLIYTSLRSLMGLLIASKWRIKALHPASFSSIYVSMREGKNCGEYSQCVVLENSLYTFAATSLTIAEIEEVNNWTQHIQFKIHHVSKSGYITINGSLSRRQNNALDCGCDEYYSKEKKQINLKRLSSFKLKWTHEFEKCSHFEFVVNDIEKKEKVSCNGESHTNGCPSIWVGVDFLIIVLFFVVSKLLYHA